MKPRTVIYLATYSLLLGALIGGWFVAKFGDALVRGGW